MMGRVAGRLLAVFIVLSPGGAGAATVDLSPGQDTLLRHLFGKAGAASGGGDAATGNPYLKPAQKPPMPLPRLPAASSDPINLLPPAAEAKTADAPAVSALPAGKAKPAKKPSLLPSPAPAAAAPKIAAVPLPRLRPGDKAAGIPLLEPRKPADHPLQEAALATGKISSKDEPVPDGPVAAAALPPAPAAVARPASLASAPSGQPPESGIELPDTGTSAALPPSPPANATPYQLVRYLQLLQDQTAQGSATAFAAEGQLRIKIEDSFAKARPEVWQDRLNAAAAVTFVLAGGAPGILHRLSILTPPPAIDQKLIVGVAAYVEGRFDDASKALGSVEANDLPASMGGEMALAQAALIVAENPERGMQLLDTARLLAPGSLVEEAALRREIMVVNQIGDQAKFEFLARQYLNRFRNSVYAGNFRYRFGAILAHFNFADGSGQSKALDDMFKDLDPSMAGKLYLTVARAAVVQGQATAAAFAGERASSLAANGSADQARAHLYRAAALAVLPDSLDGAIAERKAIAPALLKASDKALLDAASVAIEAIAKADTVVDKSGGDPAMPDSATPSPVMLRAETALQAADALLKETSR